VNIGFDPDFAFAGKLTFFIDSCCEMVGVDSFEFGFDTVRALFQFSKRVLKEVGQVFQCFGQES